MIDNPIADQSNSFLAALKGIDFDIAIFAEHARDDDHGQCQPLSCPRMIFKRDGSLVRWPRRWRSMDPKAERWIRGSAPWIDDLTLPSDPDLRDLVSPTNSPSVQTLLEFGIRSLVCLALKEGDHLAASFTLGSKSPAAYGATQYKRLRRSRVKSEMLAALAMRRERRRVLVREIRNCFKPDLSPETLASYLVTRLATELDCDFVGIYRVEDQFLLVAKCDRTPDKVFAIEEQYRQDLDTGMLGATLSRATCLRADDVSETPPPFDYLRLDNFPARSALCYPIKVGARVEWILDCETTAVAAFRGPDRELLDELAEGLQSALDLWFEYQLSAAILEGLPQAVVVVDRDGMINRANKSARVFFGLGDGDISVKLAQFAANDTTRLVLKSPGDLVNALIQFRAASGRVSRVVVNARVSGKSFGRWILQISEADELQAQVGLQFARKTVAEIANQARGPLMLASALLERVRSTLADKDLRANLDRELQRITENISKADLSYERLARGLAGKDQFTLPMLLARVLFDLPEVMRQHLSIEGASEATLRGDLTQLSRALKSLMRIAGTALAKGTHLSVSSEIHNDYATITLRPLATVTDAPSKGKSSSASRKLKHKSKASFGEDGPPVRTDDLKMMIAAQGGSVLEVGDRIEIRLPRASPLPGSQEAVP